MSNDFKPSAGGVQNYIDLNVDATLEYAEGRFMWDKENDTVVIYNSETEIALQVGQELWRRAYNNTGATITNGSIVYISGYDLTNDAPTVGLANASSAEKALSTIAVATHDVENGTIGFFTRIGTVRGLNTSGCSAGERLFLSTTDGQYTNTSPETPNYQVAIGNCSKVDASEGTIEVDINVFSNKQNATDIFNGCIQDKAEVTVTSDGVDITLSVQAVGGGDLVLYFNNTPESFDCTPPKTVTLNAGSDASPVENYVYIPESTKVLTTGSSYPTGQYVAIARVIVGSASGVQVDGTYKFHVYTDALKDENGQGHVQHVNAKIREDFASYRSGVAPTVTKVTQPAARDNLYWSNSSGEVWQLHPQSFPAKDTQVSDHLHVINDFTTKYDKITDLGAIDTDSQGNTLRSNNTCYALVIWGAVSETLGDSQLYVNAPSGSYSTVSGATSDVNNYSVYDIPTEYRGVGFLIARVIVQYQTAASGTFFTVNTEDLRGKIPNTTAGGGGGVSGGGITPVWGGANLVPYTNLSNDNYIHDSSFSFDTNGHKELTASVFEPTPTTDASAPLYSEGYMYYNSTYDTIAVYNDITTTGNYRGIFLGKMQYMHVYNNTGSTIARGKVTAYDSVQSTTLPTVVLADADTHTAIDIAGVPITDIANASTGIVCTSGLLIKTDLDYVTGRVANDVLYLSQTAGDLTLSVPSSPANQVIIGKVIGANSTEWDMTVNIMDVSSGGSATTEFSDSEFRVQDNADATKQLAFECSGITTATTQTVTIPDASGTMTLNGATQTLTNKTLTSPVLNTSVSGTAVLDEDDMASDSATQIATQQSIKAYVDTEKLSGYSIPHKNTSLTLDGTTPDEQADFTADIFVAGGYRTTNLSVTADNTSSGAGGLDTGTVAANTWYSFIVIYNPTTNTWNGLLSTTKESSNLPSGYTVQRHVGWIRTDATSDFDADQIYSCFSNFVSLNARTFISITTTGTQNLDISAYVPPSAYAASVVLILNTTNTASNITLYSVGEDSTSAYTAQVNQYVASQPISDGALAGVSSNGNVTYTFNLSGTNDGTRLEIGGFFQSCD